MPSIYEPGPRPATRRISRPSRRLSFIERTAEVYPDRLAIVHGALRQTWGETYARARRLASALQRAGIGKNDTVAVMLPNSPPMVEAHFGVPMAGAVLNALNTRLDAGDHRLHAGPWRGEGGNRGPGVRADHARRRSRCASPPRRCWSSTCKTRLFTGEATPIGSATYEAFPGRR
jgi:fatty-acyl-CoA synthase